MKRTSENQEISCQTRFPIDDAATMASSFSTSEESSSTAANHNMQMSTLDGAIPLPGLDVYRINRAEIMDVQRNIRDTADALRAQMEEHAELINLIQDLAVLAYKTNHKLDNLERIPSVPGRWTLPRKSSKVSNIKKTLVYVTALINRSYNLTFNLKSMLAESAAAQRSITRTMNNAVPTVAVGFTALRIAEGTNIADTDEIRESLQIDNVSLADFDFDEVVA